MKEARLAEEQRSDWLSLDFFGPDGSLFGAEIPARFGLISVICLGLRCTAER